MIDKIYHLISVFFLDRNIYTEINACIHVCVHIHKARLLKHLCITTKKTVKFPNLKTFPLPALSNVNNAYRGERLPLGEPPLPTRLRLLSPRS